jgi:D-alanyl-D-alanine carboxypeptidase
MKKIIFTLTLLVCISQSVMVRAQISDAFANRLQFVLDSTCNKYHIKGATAAVLMPGAGIWKGAHGESYEGAPITTDMLMGMGSNTKTHICALLLKMQENNLISLDDTIGEWIQGYPNISGQITIRQLLSHTSGLYDYMQNGAINDSIFGNPAKIWNREEILWLAKAPNFAPGTSWSYSNTGYIIAGIIIKAVLNKSPEAAMKEMILTPTGLSNTIFYGEPTAAPIPHQWTMVMSGTHLTDLNTETDPFIPNLYSLASTAGAMFTSAEDNVTFWHKLTSGQIINAISFAEMTNFRNIGNGEAYGLGIFRYNKALNGRTFYSHGGTFFGFINENMVDTTSGVCISVLTNQDSIDNGRLLASIVGALHKVTIKMPVTGLSESVYNNHDIQLYPNPVADRIYIKADKPDQQATVELYDLTGRKQLSERMESSVSGISVAHLPAGLYIARIQDQSGEIIVTQKIQVIK